MPPWRWAPVRLCALALAVAAAPSRAVDPAPDFTLTLLDGRTVPARALAGKVVVLNFWATWCAPCKKELGELDRAALRFGPTRVAIFAIDAEAAPAPRALTRQAAAMTIPVATAIVGDYRPRNNAVPTTFVIAPDGRLVLVKAGAFKPGEIATLLESLLPGQPGIR